jgi:predicted permease
MSLWSWLTRRRAKFDEEDFQEEIRAHLAIAAQDRADAGADPASARSAARRDFGNVTLTTEAARAVWLPRWWETMRDVFSDVRYAVRSLARTPAFAFIVVGVLTLGIALNASVFAMLKSLALAPLSGVDRSSQLRVVLHETNGRRQQLLSYPDFQFLREHDRAFTGLMGSMFVFEPYRLGKGKGSRTLKAEFVTGNYFQVLGVRAALGRTLLPSDEVAPGRHPVVVIGHGLWQQEFGGDPDIVGRTIEINRYPLTVVGVADAEFHGTFVGFEVEAFIPVMMAADVGLSGAAGVGGDSSRPHLLSDRRAALLLAHGFLRPDTTPAAAAALTDALSDARALDRRLDDTTQRFRILPFRQSPIGAQTYTLPIFAVLTAMGSLVLLIACANIAGLVLARSTSRRGELAARLALGATRPRIVRLLVIESLVLIVPGTMIGVLLAQRGVAVFMSYLDVLAAPQRLFFNVDLDVVTIGFAVLIASLSALVFGLAPALQASRVDLVSVINQDVSSRGVPRGRLRTGLVATQVAVSLVLLIGAGLMMRSLEAAALVHPGFDASHVTRLQLNLQQHGYDEPRGRAFYRSLLDALRADAGVESASLATRDPLYINDTPAEPLAIEGYEPQRGEDVAAQFNTVETDYFRMLRIDLVAGREFEERDTDRAPLVAIVNRTFAERFWGRADAAVGKRIRVAGGNWRTIVGVAADVKYQRIGESPRTYFYLPFAQAYGPLMTVYTRGPADTTVLLDLTRAHIAALDPDAEISLARPLSEMTRGSLWFIQITATMLFVFGAAGMALAAMGTYGLVSYMVAQQTREIGIRMALGATALSVLRLFVTRGLRLGAIGVVAGLILAFAVTRFLGSVTFGVGMTDVRSFAGALAIVIVCIILATLVSAWPVTRTNPLQALRHA